MARDYKGTSQKAEKQGNAVGGGPVGSGGGYSGRPGGSTPQKPGGPTRPQNNDPRYSASGTDRSAGSGMLLAGLAYLLLGRKKKSVKLAILRWLDTPNMACHSYHAATGLERMLVPGEVELASARCA